MEYIGHPVKLDSKNRLQIPNYMVKKLNTNEVELFLVKNNEGQLQIIVSALHSDENILK